MKSNLKRNAHKRFDIEHKIERKKIIH